MSSDERPCIKPTPDGPYLVENLQRFSNRKRAIEGRPTMALCRCGGSKNKPFCDGTHAKIGFSSAKLEGRVPDQREDYEAEKITIHDNRGICAHAGRCTDGLPSVFRLKQEPWIDPQGAPAEEIIETIRKCPSGALSYTVDGAEHRDREGTAAIFVSPNGPYVVTGGPQLLDTPRGEGASTEHFTLCRCGGSKNKPFCDGSHWYNSFSDDKN
ncbi:MAG: CDGSH iron-sulfur domain-containing protein [Pyrinomonadaceae bacterium]